MATLRRKTDGRYYMDIRIEGKRTRVSLETRDRKEAQVRFKVKEAEIEGGKGFTRQRLDMFFDAYLEYSKKTKSNGSLLNDKSIIKIAKPLLKGRYVDEITQKRADDCTAAIMAKVQAGKMTPSGASWFVRGIRSIFATAVRWNYCQSNPFEKAQKITIHVPPPNPLTEKEIAAFFNECRSSIPELYDYFRVSVMTGLRRKEQTSLTWENIDLESSLIRVMGKGKKPRVIPMLGPVHEILLERKAAGLKQPFDTPAEDITDAFNLVASKAGITNHKQHDLRKTFASYLAEMQVSDFFIRRMLGWSSNVVPSQHYITYDPAKLANIGSELASRLTAPAEPA